MCGLMSTRGCCSPIRRELEDLSPAHIFSSAFTVQDTATARCFDGGALEFRRYDAAWSELLERHDFSVAAPPCGGLAVHVVLSDAAKAGILRFCTHGGNLAQSCAKAGQTAALTFLLSLRCALCRRCG